MAGDADNLKPGDKVTTTGGMRGTIIALRDDAVQLRLPPDNIKVEVAKSAIASVTTPEEGEVRHAGRENSMRKNLNTKIIVILAAIAVCVFGIIGVPHGITPTALKDAIASRINLGLDLRGGTHLVLQVHVEEAVGTTTDSDAARIQSQLQTGRHHGWLGHPGPGASRRHPDSGRSAPIAWATSARR